MDEENDFDSSMYEEDNMEVHLSNDDEPVRKKRRHHSLQLDLDQDDEESIMSLDDFDHKKEEEEESTPITKKIKLKKSSIIPNPAVKILDSFVTPTKSHSTIQTINHKHWHVPIPPIDSPKNLINIKSKQDEDAMVIDEDDLPVLDSETKKQKKAATKITMTKLIDYNPESKKPSADSSVPGSTSIMDPRLLDEKYRHIADNLGKQLDEVASKQLMAVKNTVFDVNSQATEFLKNLIHIYDVIAKARIIQILNDDYTPTTTSYDFSLPDLMELSRTQIVSQIRAPIVTLHERVCREEKNCEGHKMFAQYIWQTANNNQSGPQFPERTASFALKEFHTPDITTQIIEKKTQGTNIMEILKDIPRQPCFFCVLYFVNNLAIQLAKNNQQIEEPMIVQPFSMIFGKPGEYAPQAQLTCGQNFNGLIAPILQYSRSNYVPFLHTIDGIDERVLGWAEIDNIIMGPAQGSNPRGDPLFKFVPPPGSSTSPFPKGKYSWRSRHYQTELYNGLVFGVQSNRMSGDTHQTGYNTATPHSSRSMADDEKETGKLRYYRKYDWLLGNNAFMEPTKANIRPTPPVTGTGTCQLPTTVQVLQSYFNDPISKVIFTNHLGYGTQEKMDNLRQLGLLMADYKSEFSNQEDPSLINICSKVRPSTFYKHILKNPIHWKLNTELVKPEFKNSPLLDWIQIRINWAIDKQQYIKELYRQKMANVHVGAWTNSWSTPQPSVPRPKEEDEDSSSSDEPETDNSPLVKDSPGKFFSTLADEVFARGIVNVNINFSSMPNTNFRFSRFPVQTDEYNVLLSDGYNTPSVTCVETFTIKPHQLNIKQANLFTYHRYWALYYIKLLDRFIQAHMEICRAMTVHDLPFQVNMKPRNKDEDDPMVQLKQFHVPTVFQPFDEAYAKWDWIPLQGHQGSFAILKSLFPSEFIFHYSLYDLYRIMTKSTNLTQDETYIVKTIKEIANQLYANWSIMPLLPPSLLPKEDEWLPPQPFTKNNYFLWTFFVVVGRLEQLKQEVKGMVFPSDNEPPVSPKQTRREMEIDFRLHQIQVRQTGYLATSRWIMSELILDHDDDPIKKQLQKDGKWTFGDDSIPESVLYFPYEEADFDAELDMIDFVPYLQKLNFWRRISLESRQNILLLPLQKGIAFRSHGRVIADFFLKIMQYKNVRYMTYLQLFIISSGFGLYRRTPEGPEMFRPSFQGLVKIDFALLQSPKTLFNFIHVSTSKVLSYMNRETLVNQVLKVPHIHKHHVLDWEQFEQNTWKVQNLIRRHLEYNKFWLQAPHNPARVTLEERIHVYEKQYTILLFHLYDFNHQMQKHFYNEHINHLDKIISLNVQLEGWKTKLKFLLLEQIEKEADAMDIDGDPTVMPVMAKETSQSLREKIEKTTIELSMINYELPEQIRSTIWQSLLGYRKDIDIWTVICQWLKDDDLLLFQRLKNAYDNFLSRAKINEIVSQFSIPAFTMIRFLLDVQITLHRVKIIPITKSMAQQIHHAMRTKRHHLFDNQPILSSVYMVYMTFCCNNLITFAGNNSYGNDQLTFIRQLNYFGCCQKKTKKDRDKGGIQKETDQSDDDSDMEEEDELSDDEQEGGSTTDAKRTQTQIIMGLHTGKAGPMEEYPNMVIKARRKIARRYDNELRTLRCHANPPVLALNLRGLRLYYGSIEFATRASQHCPRCGDLHLFTDKNFNSGRGYMCPNCIQKTWQPSFAMQRQMFCAYCGRQHFKDVEHGLETIPMYDVFDVQEPIKILQLCHNDMPKHHGDFFTESTVPDIKLPFIDTYLKRHNNLVRSTAIAQFPMQNTIDNNLNGLKINNNGFSWIRYGLRIHMIPQPVDVWWPHPKRKLLAKKK